MIDLCSRIIPIWSGPEFDPARHKTALDILLALESRTLYVTVKHFSCPLEKCLNRARYSLMQRVSFP